MQKVKLLKKPDVTDLAGEKAMIDFETGQYFLLKGAANDIWDMLRDDITVDEIIQKLMEIYEVDPDECRATTGAFMTRLEECGLIALSDA